MAGVANIELCTTDEAIREYNKRYKNIEINFKEDLFNGFNCMVQHVYENNKIRRVMMPNTRDFGINSTCDPRPDGTRTFTLGNNETHGANLHIQSMYQQLAITAKDMYSNQSLDEIFGNASIIAYAGIYSNIINCIYHPKQKEESISGKVIGDFKYKAAKLNGAIYINNPLEERNAQETSETESMNVDGKAGAKPENKNYRLSLSSLSFNSEVTSLKSLTSVFFDAKKKRYSMDILTISETDAYKESGETVEKKNPEKDKSDFWKLPKTNMHRSLQQFSKMEMSGTDFMLYTFDQKFAKDNVTKTEEFQRKDLFNRALKEGSRHESPIDVFNNMKCFLTTVLLHLQLHLAEGSYCVIQFEKKTSNRTDLSGNGRLTITFEGRIEGQPLMNEFINAFGL